MPYYTWTALDLSGNTRRGMSFAHSIESLDRNLLSDEKGLLSARETQPLFARYVSKKVIIEALSDLVYLLKAHIALDKACMLVASSQKNRYLRDTFTALSNALQEGMSFYQACMYHPDIFDAPMLGLVKAGQETGSLADTLDKIVKHQQLVATLKKELYALLLMPAITFVSFLILVTVFFVAIIPRFEVFFSSFDSPLPTATRNLLAVSAYIQNLSYAHGLVLLILLLICTALYRRYQLALYSLIVKLPIAGVIVTWQLAHILQLMSILTSGGISLSKALLLTKEHAKNKLFVNDIDHITKSVSQGVPLVAACKSSMFFCQQDIQTIIGLGESTAQLAVMLDRAAQLYHKRAYNKLKKLIAIVQPATLFILGSLIAFLLYCLYIPIFTISQVTL